MNVIPLTKENEPQWNSFVANHPKSNLYQLLGWKSVFETIFGYKHYYHLAVNDSGEAEGIMPMFLMRNILRQKYLVSNPFSNFAGICANDIESENLLLDRAAEIARSEKAQYVEFRQIGHMLKRHLPAKESFVTLMLPLQNDADVHWKHISSRNRGKIRKAEKNGLVADFGFKYLKDFHKVYSRNLRYLGTPIFPLRLFETVFEVFGKQVELLVLKDGDKVVSGMFLFKFRNLISEPWVASLRKYNKIYVNNLLYWKAIEYACENGFKLFDFGRSTVNTGTYDFKLQWGAEPVALRYHYFLNEAKEIPVVDANNNRYQKAIDLWKKLPLSFTNFAGPRVVQYLPEL